MKILRKIAISDFSTWLYIKTNQKINLYSISMGIRHFWVKYFIYPKESFLMNRGYYKAKDGDNPVIQAKDVRKRYKVTLRTAMNVVKQHNAAKEAKKGRLQKMFSNIDKAKQGRVLQGKKLCIICNKYEEAPYSSMCCDCIDKGWRWDLERAMESPYEPEEAKYFYNINTKAKVKGK